MNEGEEKTISDCQVLLLEARAFFDFLAEKKRGKKDARANESAFKLRGVHLLH